LAAFAEIRQLESVHSRIADKTLDSTLFALSAGEKILSPTAIRDIFQFHGAQG